MSFHDHDCKQLHIDDYGIYQNRHKEHHLQKWRRSLTPIISCNGRRNGSRKSILYPCCPCYSQILLCRQRVFILHHHNQVFHHRIAYNSCINHTEIGIKEQFGFRKCIKILRRNIVNTMVQPFLTLNDRHFLVTSGNGRCPKI